MTYGLAALWLIVGWCGTPWPRPWPWPWPWPWPEPEPDPWPWRTKILGAVAGLVGGYLYTQAFPMEGAVTAVDAAATGIGAFVGSVLANNVLGLIRVGSARPRG